MPGGRWAAFEVKLGQREVDAAAEQQLRLPDRMDSDVASEPIALVVVTATGYGYVRKDGVTVVPIGALTMKQGRDHPLSALVVEAVASRAE